MLEQGFLFEEELEALSKIDTSANSETIAKLKELVPQFIHAESACFSKILELLKGGKAEIEGSAASFANASAFSSAEEKAKIASGVLKMSARLEKSFQSVRELQTESSFLAKNISVWFEKYDALSATSQSALQSELQTMEKTMGLLEFRSMLLSQFYSVSTPLFFEKLGELFDVDATGKDFSISAANTLFSSYARIFEQLLNRLAQTEV